MRGKRVLAVLGIALGMAGGTAWASGVVGSIVGDDGSISGCYQKNDGRLRVVPPGTDCRPTERELAWSQQGPQGEPGAAGAGLSDLAELEGRLCPLSVAGTLVRGLVVVAPATVAEPSIRLSCVAPRITISLTVPQNPDGSQQFLDVRVGTGSSTLFRCTNSYTGGSRFIVAPTRNCLGPVGAGAMTITQRLSTTHTGVDSLPPLAWGGACAGATGSTCILEMDGDKAITVG